jgi:outer membrane receptor for ferrienterochelin and colicin
MQFRRTKIAVALGCGMLGAGTSWAQDVRVNVTGTNVKRTDTETAAPIETITREDIQASGLQTISEVVRQITANNNGSIAPAFTQGFSASGSAVSLRGLGASDTLVLVNGQIFGSIINVFDRIAPFNPAAGYGNINYNFNYAQSGATGTQFNLGARYTFQ